MGEKTLSELLIKAIELDYKNHPHDRIWVTDIAQCLRRAYYMIKYPPKPEYQLRRPLIAGKTVHLWIQDLLLKYKHELGIEVEVEKEVIARIEGIMIHGFADIVLDNVLYEIKTCRFIPPKPYFEHIIQACFYAYILGIPKYCILYIGDNGYREYCMETDDGTINIFRNRVKILKEALEQDKPPPREKTPYCSYCYYRRRCNRDKTLF